jgi:hypothetical protein
MRQLRFEHEATKIDVELHDHALRCIGRVEPPGGTLFLEQIGGERQIALSDRGAFDEIVEGVGPFRLSYTRDDVTVSTDWMQFGSPEI